MLRSWPVTRDLPEVFKVANVDEGAEHRGGKVCQVHLESLQAKPGGQA